MVGVHRPDEWIRPVNPSTPLHAVLGACSALSNQSRTAGLIQDRCLTGGLLPPVRDLVGGSPASRALGYCCGNKLQHQASSQSTSRTSLLLLLLRCLPAKQGLAMVLELQQYHGKKPAITDTYLLPQEQAWCQAYSCNTSGALAVLWLLPRHLPATVGKSPTVARVRALCSPHPDELTSWVMCLMS